MPGEFDGYVTCNFPIIRKATIKSSPTPLVHPTSSNLMNGIFI